MKYTIATILETSKISNFWYFWSIFWFIFIKYYDCSELHGYVTYEPQILHTYFGYYYELSKILLYRLLKDWLLFLSLSFLSIFYRFISKFCRYLLFRNNDMVHIICNHDVLAGNTVVWSSIYHSCGVIVSILIFFSLYQTLKSMH